MLCFYGVNTIRASCRATCTLKSSRDIHVLAQYDGAKQNCWLAVWSFEVEQKNYISGTHIAWLFAHTHRRFSTWSVCVPVCRNHQAVGLVILEEFRSRLLSLLLSHLLSCDNKCDNMLSKMSWCDNRISVVCCQKCCHFCFIISYLCPLTAHTSYNQLIYWSFQLHTHKVQNIGKPDPKP